MNTSVVGRLAPSPTGLLHLGNAWSFLWAWLWAKSLNGRIVLRMEDIDPDRSRPDFAKAIEEDLHWLGLNWDGPTFIQSTNIKEHNAALQKLEQQGHIYPCYCTRKELRSLAGAPHVDDMGAPYMGTCRELSAHERATKEEEGRRASLRLLCPQGDIEFVDAVYGAQKFNLQQCGGDFALRRSDGVLAYQLVVVVDDAAQAVSHVLRGSDILISTPRQILLCNLLNLTVPTYAHVPLLLDDKGERLAKRHQSLTLSSLREQGVRAENIVGLLAYLGGLRDKIAPVHVGELVHNFNFEHIIKATKMPQNGIVLKNEHVNCIL